MATYPELPDDARAILAAASHTVTMAYIEDDQPAADQAHDFYTWACGVYGVDPDETLKHL
ncbi:hypothetical protein ACWFMI_25145 [Nocardiopsis terrae]|uniref:hypothetical protein n=1 Tax=Streptomyces sp. NPDC057554 TaxID=3350538 RepID=UPI00367DBB1C